MVLGGAVAGDGFAVRLGGIAFVLRPTILRIVGGEAEHFVVAEGLGENAGGGDGKVFAVAFDDGVVGDDYFAGWFVIVVEAVAIDDDVLGTDGEGVEGAVHGGDARA